MTCNWLKTTILLFTFTTSSMSPGNEVSSIAPMQSIQCPALLSLLIQGPQKNAVRGYHGALSNKAMINQLLAENQIGAVLRLVWAEQDTNSRLSFLHAQAQNGYAIFMLELARNLINSKPRDALFWYFAGAIRAHQDAISCQSTAETGR